MKKQITLAFASMLVFGSQSASASDVQYDKSVAAGAAKKAAEKLGKLRPAIDFDQEPGITQKGEPETKVGSQLETQYIAPKPNYQKISDAGHAVENLIEQYVDPNSKVDYTTTASINSEKTRHETRIVWQKFDDDGNLIH